ncbi:putative Zn-dependent protease [Alkalispirillum mobile]|uniref:Putative beta-barrel assembly-enhancing protease n=1 Tax=Alkalispirillum mobile TaxID=85925 RepID=A0A498BY79_9GAMM|nr:M48 family metalloprotease [Alkalispirillum mobile]RLK48252.1 putative Zn-dependent protease [Alkalispirillum mobile]
MKIRTPLLYPFVALLAVIVLLVSFSPAKAGDDLRLPDLGDPASQALSQAEEQEIGDELMRQLRRHIPLSDDPELTAYVEELGQRLAAHSDMPGLQYTFFLVEDDNINAFAMPGGYIGINTGLIDAARTESELAAVMAHEIAHVTQRHIARHYATARRLNLQTAASLLAAVLIGAYDPQAGSAAAMAGLGGTLQQQLNYSRAFEREADRVGLRILARSGLDPQGMPGFFERLLEASRYRERAPEYLSTHPLTENRVSESRARAEAYETGEPLESGQFHLIQARLRVQAINDAREAVEQFRARTEQTGGAEQEGARYGLALALIRDRQFDEAEALLEQLEETLGSQPAWHLAMGRLRQEAGELEAAIKTYEQAQELFPGNRAIPTYRAEALMAADRPGEARQVLTRAVRSHPGHPELKRRLAEAASEAGRPVDAHLAMARYYHQLGDLSSALGQLREVERHPEADHYQQSRAAALQSDWQRQAADR